MIRSMTGYGKAEAGLKNGKLTIEIRTLNGKTADINLKSQESAAPQGQGAGSALENRFQTGKGHY